MRAARRKKGVGLTAMSEDESLSDVASPSLLSLCQQSPCQQFPCQQFPCQLSGASEDEDTVRWRAALRRQVEEDLERQVRLRLGLGLRKRERKTAADTEPRTLTHHQPTHHTLTCHTTTEPKLPTHKGENTSAGSKGCEGEEGEGNREVRSSEVQWGERGERSGNRRHSSHTSISHKAKEDILHYLSRHHGPPLQQLQQLSTGGTYQTTTSTATEEGGPEDAIHWPVEANIVLPTPHHITTSPLTTSTHHVTTPHNITQSQVTYSQPQRQLFGAIRNIKNDGATRQLQGEGGSDGGKVVYKCGKGGVEGEKRVRGELVFESRFEGGNLCQARQTGPQDYTLLLNPDLYSKRHVQWYYFRVTNMETATTYTFHIVNFEKTDSLYNHGMQPLLYSESEATSTGMGWRRVGWNVSYHHSTLHYPPHMSPDRPYFTLSWSMQFDRHDDTCYLAHCYPYPLSALHQLLSNIQQDQERAQYVHREELCQTLAGNVCPLLTITDFSSEEEGEGSRRGVVITARVHPGETNSSWMMEGLISFLTSQSPHAHALRQSFIFKVVPMLNPDGVVVGNYRTSLAGVDLNRMYKTPYKTLFPTIYHTKKMIKQFLQERQVCVYIDLHGHSRKHNVFMYGCRTPNADHTHFLYDRLLPFLLSQQAPSKFSLSSCKFAVQRYKEATGRVVTWRSGVRNSFTLEATFCGSNLGPSSWQFSESDLCEVGRDLGEALYKFNKCLHNKTYQLKVMAQLADTLMAKLATPTNPTPSHVASLPDVVTTHLSRSLLPQKRHTQHTLCRFMKLDLNHVLQESSTSGSDSENEDFRFKRKKSKHRNHRQRRSLMSQTQSHLPSLPPSSHTPPSHTHSHPHFTSTKSQRPQLTLPSLLEQAPPTNRRKRASAPARLQSSQCLVATGSRRKFVNRYANRSNGGIPMFAEERMRERTEKRLRSVSETVCLPPLPPCAAGMDTQHASLVPGPRPLQTYCPDSIPQTTLRTEPRLHHVSPRQQHYQQIKDLVEKGHHSHHSFTPHFSHISNHTHSHPPSYSTCYSSQRSSEHLPILPSSQLPTLPSSHLPTHLISYIIEVWNKEHSSRK